MPYADDLAFDAYVAEPNDANLQALYDATLAHVRRVVRLKIDEYDDSLPSEIADKVISSLPRFEKRALFSTWVHRAAINGCTDELRRRQRRDESQVSLDTELYSDDGERKNFADRERPFSRVMYSHLLLNELLADMTPDDRYLINSWLDGVFIAEIGAKLGISERTVGWRIRELKARMLKQLSKRGLRHAQ